MRPDHIRLITRVRSALRHDHWAVVAHPTTPEQAAQVKAVLHGSAEVVSTPAPRGRQRFRARSTAPTRFRTARG